MKNGQGGSYSSSALAISRKLFHQQGQVPGSLIYLWFALILLIPFFPLGGRRARWFTGSRLRLLIIRRGRAGLIILGWGLWLLSDWPVVRRCQIGRPLIGRCGRLLSGACRWICHRLVGWRLIIAWICCRPLILRGRWLGNRTRRIPCVG